MKTLEVHYCNECYFLFDDDNKNIFACSINSHKVIKPENLEKTPNWCPLLKEIITIKHSQPCKIYEDIINEEKVEDEREKENYKNR